MKEKAFWLHLEKELPPGIHATRIESDCSPGFPDVHYTLAGITGSIELKSTRGLKKVKCPFSKANGLNPSQKRWIKDELDAGGKVVLALCVYPQVLLLDAFLWAHQLDQMSLQEIEEASTVRWVRGQKRTDQQKEALRAFLVSPP